MATRTQSPTPFTRLQVLAEFRHQLRNFLQFSETAAHQLGLQPQQHQLMLQIAGAPPDVPATVGYAARQLGLRHNTVVELCDRCVAGGLIVRLSAGDDRRRVLLQLSTKGRKMLEALSIAHAQELNDLAPELIRSLAALRVLSQKANRTNSRTAA